MPTEAQIINGIANTLAGFSYLTTVLFFFGFIAASYYLGWLVYFLYAILIAFAGGLVFLLAKDFPIYSARIQKYFPLAFVLFLFFSAVVLELSDCSVHDITEIAHSIFSLGVEPGVKVLG